MVLLGMVLLCAVLLCAVLLCAVLLCAVLLCAVLRGSGRMRRVSWLGVVRHGESVGNVAAQRAEVSGADRVEVDTPDADTPLSPTGREQAAALGRWLAADPPDVVIASTYLRARQTAELAIAQLAGPPPLRIDERLRDRELGILDRLTRHGIARLLPEEDARRRFNGVFYYRPPGGESWADGALRLRSFLHDLPGRYGEGKVLLVAHEAIVMILRYLVEDLTVDELLELSRGRLRNAGLTSWRDTGDGLRLEAYDRPTGSAPSTRQDDV
jgi:probable phosphoglycerate mutase